MNENLFGQWITYTHKIIKSAHKEGNVRITEHPAIKFKSKPTKVLLIGERYLQNGRTHYSGLLDEHGEWTSGGFTVTSTTRCLMVVTNPRKNPIRVAISGAKLLNGLLVEDLLL